MKTLERTIEAWTYQSRDQINGFLNSYESQFCEGRLIAYIINGVFSSAFVRFTIADTEAAWHEITAHNGMKLKPGHHTPR
jgi:hypothetical protein